MISPIRLVTQALPKTRRLRRPRRQREPRGVERSYAAEVKSVTDDLWGLIEQLLLPRLPEMARLTGVRSDDFRTDQFGWPAILREIFADIGSRFEAVSPRIQVAAEEASRQTSLFNRQEVARQMRSVVGVDIFYNEPKLIETLEEFTRANVAAIRSIPANALGQMEQIISNGFRGGRRASELAKEIRDRFDVSQSKAQFLARDQIGSLNAQLTKQRQEAIGIDEYIWRTSKDENVRAAHARLEGRKFSWDNPPTVGQRRVHPGEDYGCRCTAEPIIEV